VNEARKRHKRLEARANSANNEQRGQFGFATLVLVALVVEHQRSSAVDLVATTA